MDEAWKRARLDELWDVYVPTENALGDGANAPRVLRAIEALTAQRIEHGAAKAAEDFAGMILAASKARMIWQLLTLEVGDWMLNDDPWIAMLQPEAGVKSRFTLDWTLRTQLENGPHPHRPALDPVPVLLPRWLLIELRSALAALDEGETHDIVRAAASGRHDDAWSWDQMRARALEHVAYLHGQDHTKQIARQRVAARMGIPPASLRDWERKPVLMANYPVAFEAGKLKTIFDDNPKYAEGDGSTVDSGALARLHRFHSEPSLAEFGSAYKERFGRRHNPGGSAGD